MTHSNDNSPMEFKFEGQFLGFVSRDGKLKYLRLQMLSEEMQIKIPKAVRLASCLSLQAGQSIQVTGIGKFDSQTHALKLKATEITSLREDVLPIVPVTPSSPASVAIQPSEVKPKIKSKIKVLICQKSGCLKKGGKGLCEALTKTLRDRNLDQAVSIERTGCLKRCSGAPNLVIMPGNHRYTQVRAQALPQIADAIAEHLARR
jgi:(2Fe-2S) ferredoxin